MIKITHASQVIPIVETPLIMLQSSLLDYIFYKIFFDLLKKHSKQHKIVDYEQKTNYISETYAKVTVSSAPLPKL